jgi:hypothetical protein
MDSFTRIVLGYHGCKPEFAEAMIRGEISIDQWEISENPYDWLGHGLYFWEFGPDRAKNWGKGGVVGAVIQLGVCLDLMDTRYMALLAAEFKNVRKIFEKEGINLPENKGKRHDLDCLVLNNFVDAEETRKGTAFQTVRCPFLEGPPVFPGSKIRSESHIQIAVRDRSCLLGIFRPNPV